MHAEAAVIQFSVPLRVSALTARARSCVHVCVYDGFCYQFMEDYTGSFHSYFSSMNILPSYKQKAIFETAIHTGADRGGTEKLWLTVS